MIVQSPMQQNIADYCIQLLRSAMINVYNRFRNYISKINFIRRKQVKLKHTNVTPLHGFDNIVFIYAAGIRVWVFISPVVFIIGIIFIICLVAGRRLLTIVTVRSKYKVCLIILYTVIKINIYFIYLSKSSET